MLLIIDLPPKNKPFCQDYTKLAATAAKKPDLDLRSQSTQGGATA
nr:hypothetical protein [uncultured Deefgea sp.]